MIDYVLFDLDNTLYPAASGLGQEMSRRMTEFVGEYMGISVEAAGELRRENVLKYGTTLTWLKSVHGLETVEPYLERVHPADVSPWITDEHARDAQAVLERLDLPAAILTNGPREHAQRVLDRLGISDRFERMFDLRSNGFVGKPAPSAYCEAVDALGIRFETTLFVDDVVQYLLPFRDLGGRIVHLSTPGSEMPGVPTISALGELTSIIYPDRSRG